MTDQIPTGPPDFLHQMVWGRIASLFRFELQRATPMLGTITHQDGVRVGVIPDGEGNTPWLAYHVAGQRYVAGQRVLLQPVRGTDPVVVGSMVTSAIDESVVGAPDIGQWQVTGFHIAPSTINGNHIIGGTILGTHIAAGAVTNTNIAQGTISMDRLTGSVQNAIAAGDHAHPFAPLVHPHNYAPRSIDIFGSGSPTYAPWPHDHTQYTHYQGDFVPLFNKEFNDRKRLSKVCVQLFGAANCGLPETTP